MLEFCNYGVSFCEKSEEIQRKEIIGGGMMGRGSRKQFRDENMRD